MKLSYWVCKNLSDSAVYNLRSPSKKLCKELRESTGIPENFTQPYRVDLEYTSGFDLLFRCLSLGRLDDNEIEWEVTPKEK